MPLVSAMPLTQDVDHAPHLVRRLLAAGHRHDLGGESVVGPAGRSPPGQKRVDLGVRRADLGREILGLGEHGGDLVGEVVGHVATA